MAGRARHRRREREGKFSGFIDVLDILVEVLTFAPRLIFGFFRMILKLLD